MRRWWHDGWVVLLIISAGLLWGVVVASAWGQDHESGHAQYHDNFYSRWKMPGTDISCCNAKETVDGLTTGDCYPTDAEFVQDHWVALRDNGVAIVVPDERIIHEHNPDQTGRKAHLCESHGHVYCFVPPSGGT